MKRYPAVAGSFYESDPRKLIERIKWSFLHQIGPGKLPEVRGKQESRISLFIVPHAGYVYSGPVAAHSYYRLGSLGKPDVVLILGPDHNGVGPPVSVFADGEWVTPLGEIKVNKQLALEVAKETEVADVKEEAHLYEHSIEVQLPFLQYLYDPSITVVPVQITMQTPEFAEFVSEGVFRVIQGHRDIRFSILASTDMNHYDSHEITLRKDEMAIEKIMELDHVGLYRVVEQQDVTMCGFGPTMALLRLAKKLGAKPVLLKHATSGDTSGDKSSVVGYLSMEFSLPQ